MNEFQVINSLRKEGRLDEAYARAQQALQNAPDDLWIKRAMGWVLYDLLKVELKTVADDEGEVDDNSPSVNLKRIQRYFDEYQQLELPCDDKMIHSAMLRLSTKAQRAGWSGFVEFVQWWGLENLTDEDRRPSQSPEGREIPSLEQTVLYALGRACRQLPSNDVRGTWIHSVIEDGLSRYPDDIWLMRTLGYLDALRGQSEQAQQRLLGVLRRKPREWWLWKEMAELLEPLKPEDAVWCYYRACELMHDKPKLVGVYQRLARLLESQERYAEAAWFVQQAYTHRTQQGWKIPAELEQMRQAEWFQLHSNAPEPQVETAPFARRFLRNLPAESLQHSLAVLDHHNHQKQIAYLLLSPREGLPTPHREFPQLSGLSAGTVLEVVYAEDEGRKVVVECRAAPSQEIPGFVRRVRGKFQRRPDQSFGFIQADTQARYFAPPAVASQIVDGADVEAVCVLKYSEKRDREEWVAVRVETVEPGRGG